MKKHSKIIVFFLTLTVILFLFWRLLIWLGWGQVPRFWVHEIDVSGSVVDAQTGEPITSARVIIQVNRTSFLRWDRYRFGLITDERGRFSIKTSTPIRVDSIDIYASTPSNQYGEMKFVQNPVKINVEPLPEDLQRYDFAHYDRFSGRYSILFGAEKLEFPGDSWETRTPQEIEIGIPSPIVRKGHNDMEGREEE